jgi:probable HAF family extracellular repeat protein
MSRSLRFLCVHRLTLSAANSFKCVAAIILSAALAVSAPVAAWQTQYKLIDTGTLGGPTSSMGFEGARNLNNRGTLISGADTALQGPCFICIDGYVAHGVEWRNGVLTDLGALPGANTSGAVWISDSGWIAGLSENGVIDPLTGVTEVRALSWKDGSAFHLGTLGGNDSAGIAVNDRGQVVGCATTTDLDPYGGFCFGTQQTRAFLWQDGVMRDLGTLGGPDAFAFVVNESGQVAGWSFTNSSIPTQHPFLWENGRMHDLGTIGGTLVPQVNGLNNRGQVIGQMTVAGDQSSHPFLWDGGSLKDLGTFGGDSGAATSISDPGAVVGWACIPSGCPPSHAFLWRRGVMTDLGVLPGNACSIAYSVNSRTQIVGTSDDDCSLTNAHAFLWQDGSMADLNTLIAPGSGVQLVVGLTINERGEIAAQGVLQNGDLHAFLLIPSGTQ